MDLQTYVLLFSFLGIFTSFALPVVLSNNFVESKDDKGKSLKNQEKLVNKRRLFYTNNFLLTGLLILISALAAWLLGYIEGDKNLVPFYLLSRILIANYGGAVVLTGAILIVESSVAAIIYNMDCSFQRYIKSLSRLSRKKQSLIMKQRAAALLLEEAPDKDYEEFDDEEEREAEIIEHANFGEYVPPQGSWNRSENETI